MIVRGLIVIVAVQIAAAWCFAREGAAAPNADAEVLVSKGLELRKAGKDTDALDLFRRAYSIDPSARTLAQIALALQALGRWVEAETHLQTALDDQKDEWIKGRRGALESALKTIRQRLASLEITGGVPGATVRLNGESVGSLPFRQPVRVLAGSIVIEVLADGYWPMTRVITAPPGGAAREDFRLGRIEQPNVSAAAPNASAAAPNVSEAAPNASAAAPNASEAAPSAASSPPAPAAIGASGGSPTTAATDAPVEAGSGRTLPWIAAGAAGAAAIAGVVAVVVRGGHASNWNDDGRCLQPGLTRSQACGTELDAAESAGTVAAISFVAAGLLGAGSAALFLLGSGDSEAATVGLAPRASGVTAAVCGRF